ncbi:hypothetical protein ABT126_12165 [Streptomyces sp. NPDC002012]|uniref:hypothetical protein n=1 Tax=Streptomyces sp. NPDC002012 TaxID=3154532 RepID=UPI0033260CFE
MALKTLLEEAVVEALHVGGDEAVRLYVAACAERMAPLFIGLRSGDSGRKADVDFFVESVGGLWFADRPLPDAADRVGRLERFPELQSAEEGITGVADTYTFFAGLVLRYALLANGSGNADHAVSCGHVALTAMGMLDQNTRAPRFVLTSNDFNLSRCPAPPLVCGRRVWRPGGSDFARC